MITMEFDEMKKIWDSQNKEPLYAINKAALHNRVMSKQKNAYHITNTSELLLIIVNAGAGLFVLGVSSFKQNLNIWMYCLAAWMLLSAFYMLVSRLRRIKASQRFDRSILGDLSHAIELANYQVRLSRLGRWNIVPIGLFCLLALWEGGKPIWLLAIIAIFLVLVFFAGKWEHSIYKTRKRELEILQSKLESMELSNRES